MWGGRKPQSSSGLNNVSSIYTFSGPELSPIVAPNVTKVWKISLLAISSFIKSTELLQATRALVDISYGS